MSREEGASFPRAVSPPYRLEIAGLAAFVVDLMPDPSAQACFRLKHQACYTSEREHTTFPGLQVGAFIAFMLFHTTFCKSVGWGRGQRGKKGEIFFGALSLFTL